MEIDVITIDGPTSSGKNSVGFLLAQKLGYQYIDSGSIYRAGSILVLRKKISSDNTEEVTEVFRNLRLKTRTHDHEVRFLVDGEDITDFLHNTEVTQLVPVIAAIAEVREAVKVIQYKLVSSKNTVMTGRDIGSEIFPNVKHKFFLTADVEVRAKRRFEQLVVKDPNVKYEVVLENMKDRDKQDETREISPLRIPEGAIVIDNSNLTVEQTVEEMLKSIQPNVILSD
ncbi:(d)CMP kinase [Candidatus Daviesbacteria bacterium]|nr:(d)CMP kinase [Candidatus Daviesbacteria bacterium]